MTKQGGFSPAKLAAFAHRVPKPANWKGSIILHGCSTGHITDSVSKEYFKLAGRPVTVMGGTRAHVQVGMAADSSQFIGSD